MLFISITDLTLICGVLTIVRNWRLVRYPFMFAFFSFSLEIWLVRNDSFFFFLANYLNLTSKVPTAHDHSTQISMLSCHYVFSCPTCKKISHFPPFCLSIFSFYLLDRLHVSVLSCLSSAVDTSWHQLKLARIQLSAI